MASVGTKRNGLEKNHTELQGNNQKWWTDYTMSYDWNTVISYEKYSLAWFDEIDKRFIYGMRLFAHNNTPFDKIIPFKELFGKKVLEIGCGMGLHSELLVRAGAILTSIDISETSVKATKTRFSLKKMNASIIQMDAEKLLFPDDSFDFVWSWGVIHHSAHTALILKEISRVLKNSGEVRFMVYNLNGMAAYFQILRRYVLGFWADKTLDQVLWKQTDGYMARYYSVDMLRDILSLFYNQINIETFAQDADALPLPRYIRKVLLKLYSTDKLSHMGNKRGAFLFAIAKKAGNLPNVSSSN